MKLSKPAVWTMVILLISIVSLGRTFYSSFRQHQEETQLQELVLERRNAWLEFVNTLQSLPSLSYEEVDKFHDVQLLSEQIAFSDQYKTASVLFNERVKDIYRRQVVVIAGEHFEKDAKTAAIYRAAIEQLNKSQELVTRCMNHNKEFYAFLLQNQQNFSVDQGRIFFNEPSLGQKYQMGRNSLEECKIQFEESSKEQEAFKQTLLEMK